VLNRCLKIPPQIKGKLASEFFNLLDSAVYLCVFPCDFDPFFEHHVASYMTYHEEQGSMYSEAIVTFCMKYYLKIYVEFEKNHGNLSLDSWCPS
jgi:hypothetical protein